MDAITTVLMLASLAQHADAPWEELGWSFRPREEKRVLEPGGEVGTFRYRHEGKVRWSAKPAYPVTVTLNQGRRAIFEKQFDTGQVAFELDLRPGTYQIRSDPVTEKTKKVYWGAFGPKIHIDADGIAWIRHQDLLHQKIVELIGPKRLVVVEEKRPVLRWEPVEEAAYYHVGWFEKTPDGEVVKTEQNLRAEQPCYRFEEDLVPNRTYEWMVQAFGENGERIAHSNGYFRSEQTGGFLGVQLRSLDRISARIRRLGVNNGALIEEVASDSPAIEAGLRPGDVILAIDEMPIATFDDVAGKLREVPPGTTVAARVLRNGKELEVSVRVGKRPVDVWEDPLRGECDSDGTAPSIRDAAERGAHRLRRVDSVRISHVSASRAIWSDLDRDGRKELLVPSWCGSLCVIDTEMNARCVTLSGTRDYGSITAIEPVSIGDEAHFFVAFTKYDRGGKQRACRAGLYRASGEEVWVFSPTTVEGSDAEIDIAAGNLDADDAPEFVIGLSTYRRDKIGPSSFRRSNEKARVLLLDDKGALLTDTKVGRSIEMVAVVASYDSCTSSLLLCVVDDAVRRYELRGAEDDD